MSRFSMEVFSAHGLKEVHTEVTMNHSYGALEVDFRRDYHYALPSVIKVCVRMQSMSVFYPAALKRLILLYV